jgi:VCBS repeat-containing protein
MKLLRRVGFFLISFSIINLPTIQTASASAVGWQIQMLVTGKKTVISGARQTSLGSPGSSGFRTATASSTSASSRTTLGAGEGVYNAFFSQTGITKIALVDGTGSSLDPTSHTNYLVYDLVESTGSESINSILKRLDEYQRTAASFQNNDSVWGSNSAINHTAGYSGVLSASGGSGFRTTPTGMPSSQTQIPDRFAIMGINRDSDNDIQALAAYWGNLSTTSGKGDYWRGEDPHQTFWSYWGNDFHSSSQTQRIGASYQTSPGVASGAAWTGNVYLLAYSVPDDATAPTITGPSSATGATSSISISETATAVHTFTANESVTWSRSGTDQSFFTISSGGALTITARNFEAPADSDSNNTYVVLITATDGAANATNQTLTVTITNINEAPTITINSSASTHTFTQAENISTVATYTATDVDAGTTLSFSLSGTDAADFSIDSSSGAFAFAANPDFEAPQDADTNNSYIVIVTVSDGSLTDTQTVTVNITNASESASINAPTVSGTINKGIATTITVTINVAGKVRFFVGGKRISTCKDRTTSGSYPNNTATCSWRPAVTGRQTLTATLTPTDNTFSASTSAPTTVQVVRRGTVR